MNTADVTCLVDMDSARGGTSPATGCRIQVTAWSLPRNNATRRARELLRSQLDGLFTDQAVLDDLDIVVSELASNAYRHTDGPCEMRILHHEDVPVVCEIADTGGGLDEIAQYLRHPALPVDVDALDGIEGLTLAGRGLGIVAHLTGGRCGVQTTRLCGTGQPAKSVWFAIPVGTHTRLTHAAANGR